MVPPYTAEEKQWLRVHFDGEFKFLMAYGLSIYDEDERAEGRLIARAMMANDG
ncbi:hypothetical protein QC762_302987 [Podospora pseudocomata]|uniref:Uncharacterized protein n=3 Tax=Podospora TaxID=5144 RepID=A0ABR0HFX6_9PEZI|nr:hypothetical protein QC762_302987 [Podospora pseudocomata]KAK4666747.1 hypothetical protein QC763_302987 [Podospora pseudopauciseta]KAK4677919.1 hypothetical protein QC764_302987 [Podospora pseudoanserina]